MSWPTDGKPRYVTASIEGGFIDTTGDPRKGGSHAPVYYIYDRAYCHRVVRRLFAGTQRYNPSKGGNRLVPARVEIERICAEMNA